MANEDHLKILKQGVEAWNQWRKEHRNTRPDLSEADLKEANLSLADLYQANLYRADLIGANLGGATLYRATLYGAGLREADLSEVDLRGADLKEANLSQANLTEADLSDADLRGANLSEADLRGVNLTQANLGPAYLSQANLSQASVGWTSFADVDLSTVKGLETVRHEGPSTIGIDTIYRSKGNIPEPFLRGAGVPDTFITYITSLTGQAIQYYSCFISYSSKDEEFAQRLHADLQQKDVRCWFAPEDLKIGAKIRPTIDETIRLHDKLLLVLSEHSVASQWVEQEVETALARERKQDEIVLFPIRLDNAVMEMEGGWPALIKNTRNIGDFNQWKDHDAYQKALNRLLRDLKAEGIKPSM